MKAQRTATNTLLLTWPAAFGSGFVLQQNSDPATANWGTNNAPVTQNNGTNQVVVLSLSERQFYRLVLP